MPVKAHLLADPHPEIQKLLGTVKKLLQHQQQQLQVIQQLQSIVQQLPSFQAQTSPDPGPKMPKFPWFLQQYLPPLSPNEMKAALQNLQKIYANDEAGAYSGIDDFLDLKLAYFFEICYFCCHISESGCGYAKGFPMMLKGEALRYHNDVLKGQNLSFREMVEKTRQHFETLERHLWFLTRWHALSLRDVMRKKEGNSVQQCFEILRGEMELLIEGLWREYQVDGVLRNRLLIACQDV